MTDEDRLPDWLPDSPDEIKHHPCHPVGLVPADPDHGLDTLVVWQSVQQLVSPEGCSEGLPV